MNFIKRNKIATALFAVIFSGLIFIAGYSDKQVYVISDTSLAAGDTILATLDIGSAPNVAVTLQSADTVNAKLFLYYGYGTGQRISLAATDTVSAIGTTVPVSKGKVLRGYGLATDLIPGANRLYIKAYINEDGHVSEAGVGEYVKAAVITAD